MSVPGWPEAFRGSAAITAGLVSRAKLRGAGFVRMLPDVYVPTPPGGRGGPAPGADHRAGSGRAPIARRGEAGAYPVRAYRLPLRVRSLAAYRWAQHLGAVVSGCSAAELHGASCARPAAPAEITVPGRSLRAPAGVLVRRDALPPDEIQVIGDVRITGPLRTAFDLARRQDDLVEAVVAVDALANQAGFEPDSLLILGARHRGARAVERLADVLVLADRRSGSPMETRLQLILVLAGLPRPAVQHPVLDDERRCAVWLDLAHPEARVGIIVADISAALERSTVT
jgi:hypothetical protein